MYENIKNVCSVKYMWAQTPTEISRYICKNSPKQQKSKRNDYIMEEEPTKTQFTNNNK